jgi:hypothetical protein
LNTQIRPWTSDSSTLSKPPHRVDTRDTGHWRTPDRATTP